MKSQVFKTFLPESVEVNNDQRKSVFTISSGSVDRDNDIVNPDGWDFAEYRKNPIILWAHDAKQLPLAKSAREWVVDGRVRSVAEFPEKGVHPFADQVFALVGGGFIRGTSVGFRPIAAEPRQKGGYHYQRQELMEYSILPIPSNRDALREAKGAGLEVKGVIEWCKQAIEAGEDGIWLPREMVEKALMLAEPRVAGFAEKGFSDDTHSRTGGKFSGMTHGDRSLVEQAAAGAARFPGHKRHPLDVASERDAMGAAHRLIAHEGRTKPLSEDEKALLSHMAARVQPGKAAETKLKPPKQGDPTRPGKPAKLPKKEGAMFVVLSDAKVDKFIREDAGQFTVHAEDGKAMGTYPSKAQAKKRLAQIEYFKQRDAQKAVGDVGPTGDDSYCVFDQTDLDAQPDSETATVADDGDNDDLTSEDVSIMALAQKLFSEDKGAPPFPPKKRDPKEGDPPPQDGKPADQAPPAPGAAPPPAPGAPPAPGQEGQPKPEGEAGDPSKLQADMKQVEGQIASLRPGDPVDIAAQLKTILEAFAAIVMQDLTGVPTTQAAGQPPPPGQPSNPPGQMPPQQRGVDAEVMKAASEMLGISMEEMAEVVSADGEEAAAFGEWTRKEFGVDPEEFRALLDRTVNEKMSQVAGRLPD